MRQRIFYFLLLCASVTAYGQVSLDLITDKKEYTTRDLIELTVVLEINGSEYNQETPIRLPDFSHFYERGTGSTKNSIISPESNAMVSQIVYQMVLQPKQSGTYKIGSALVKVNGKIYKTEPFDITISDKGEKSLAKNTPTDLFLTMETEDREVYVNEPLRVVLRAYTKDFNNFRKIKKIAPPSQKNLAVFATQNTHSEIEMNPRGQMASQILAVYTLYPNKAGKMEIPPSFVEIFENHNKLKSNSLQINVKELPQENMSNSKNIVGDFQLKFEKLNPNQKTEIDKPIDLIISLNGKGNLSENILPTIKKSKDYEIFPPKIIKNIRNTDEGLEGEITAQYILIPKKVGDIDIQLFNFSFFNPKEEKYVDLGEKSLTLKISPEQEKTTLEKVNNMMDNVGLPLLKSDKKENIKQKKNDTNIWFSDAFVLVFSALGILLGAFIFLRKRKENETKPTENHHENIADIEKKLQYQNLKSSHLAEMEYHIKNKNYPEYLEILEKTLHFWEKSTLEKLGISLEKHLENAYNQSVKNEYLSVLEKIQFLKFSPIKADEEMKNLHHNAMSILIYMP